MKLIKGQSKIYVDTHTSNLGYECNDTYIFPNETELKKFLSSQEGVDIYNKKHYLNDYEIIISIYERTDYEINY